MMMRLGPLQRELLCYCLLREGYGQGATYPQPPPTASGPANRLLRRGLVKLDGTRGIMLTDSGWGVATKLDRGEQ